MTFRRYNECCEQNPKKVCCLGLRKRSALMWSVCLYLYIKINSCSLRRIINILNLLFLSNLFVKHCLPPNSRSTPFLHASTRKRRSFFFVQLICKPQISRVRSNIISFALPCVLCYRNWYLLEFRPATKYIISLSRFLRLSMISLDLHGVSARVARVNYNQWDKFIISGYSAMLRQWFWGRGTRTWPDLLNPLIRSIDQLL